MASISMLKNGRCVIQFFDGMERRRSISVGRISKEAAEFVKEHVERLVQAQMVGHEVDKETAEWLSGLEKKMTDKLAKAGLIHKQHAATSLRPAKATNEQKIREYLKIYAIEKVEAKKRKGPNSTKKGSASKLAAKAVGMSHDRARMGTAVIKYIDSIEDENKKQELIESLNSSISPTFAMIPKSKSVSKKSIDSSVVSTIYGLARKFDEFASLCGGEPYRDDCISLLKQLSGKYEEWKKEV